MCRHRYEWPATERELVVEQHRVAAAADEVVSTDPWVLPHGAVVFGACFVAFARRGAGPGHLGDHAWAGAVAWKADASESGARSRSGSVLASAVVAAPVPAAYSPGLLARRDGPILELVLERLVRGGARPDVLLVDATGRDHPRRAGLAVHLGAVLSMPTVGVTHRALVATGEPPALVRGERSPARIDGEVVGFWVCTRPGARPVLAHAAWRTNPETAARTVLAASTPAARTPEPLREARRVARRARASAEAA
ncbi:MAG: hypothetical protein KatS3mg010_0262 [Acidimicrobiia bacterium]|nr:MAG: hypothetical protein KatS3mg010_0262 [Acidimicrobiia bacterium]